MSNFKVMRELVKALTCVADAIAGTYKGSNSQDGSDVINDGQSGTSESDSSNGK